MLSGEQRPPQMQEARRDGSFARPSKPVLISKPEYVTVRAEGGFHTGVNLVFRECSWIVDGHGLDRALASPRGNRGVSTERAYRPVLPGTHR